MTESTILLLFFSSWAFTAFIGCLIGSFRNRRILGLILGILLGPIGWIIMLFIEPAESENTEGCGCGVAMILLIVACLLVFALLRSRQQESARAEELRSAKAELDARDEAERKRKAAEVDAILRSGYRTRELYPAPTPLLLPRPTPLPMPSEEQKRKSEMDDIRKKYGQ